MKEKELIKQSNFICRDCILCKLNNPEHPICNYHQGIKQATQTCLEEEIKFLERLEKYIFAKICNQKFNRIGLAEIIKKEKEELKAKVGK